MASHDIAQIPCALVRERVDARSLNLETIVALKESIARLGVLNPILVRRKSVWDSTKWVDGYEVIAGNHRRRACTDLGFETMPASIIEADDVAAELSMIAENLHRSDLTALQRDEQVARWIDLVRPQDKGVQIAPPKGGKQPYDIGLGAAERDLGLNRDDARRAVRVAGLAPEAKEAARGVGLDNNRSALLAAAKEPTSERQVAKLSELAAAKQAPKDSRSVDEEEQQFWRYWARLSIEAKRRIKPQIVDWTPTQPQKAAA